MNREELIDLFEKHSDLINMGTSDDAPDSDWIDAAEKKLLVNFPADYKWFLNNYGGGDICGEEIYSIYCLPFNEAVGGDIVYQNVIANNNLETGKVALSNTDFGEEFFFDTNDMEKIYVSIGNNRQLYASGFLEYLKKRLLSYV
ncbi:SMI1/KNR4 family protein [Erwinia tracheiphila]|uniref:SMI1/KNR4 family protein n=1 Tax=Erwinia tracheiphila TaxID=65700 RepID=A0A345CUF9_9GAMM|nr:SMI1/KNR4 family protein [Erwinia tracheiphila]AXF77076.1 SMI1/KNR4 family protein [Erwinia tracheiphila]AXF77082.1 SMI1/KNR4 family protein [Erwinia tracheiphila]UIA84232.1 SMI1/KNR4 family protein [Erwinia tracheiphila]UIA84239.1 SMI1/KNR4 family protein [Erwinia tracheiphila]UIA92812.1 SMI1/KNR4 family protein [Erwinia tracheiphila]